MGLVLDLSSIGFRQLGALPGGSANDLAKIAAIGGLYEACGTWIRRQGRKVGAECMRSFELIDVIGIEDSLGRQRLDFIDRYFKSEFATTGLPPLLAEIDVLEKMIKEAESADDRCRGMYRLCQSLSYAGEKRLRQLFIDQVAPCFFRMYPQGKIGVIRYNAAYDSASTLMRVLYAATQARISDIRSHGFVGINTLSKWHLTSVTTQGPLLLNLLLYAFYPFISGMRGGPTGLDFVFLFEPAEQYNPAPFPRSWMAKANSTASIGREHFDLYEAIRDYGGPTWHRAGHQRPLLQNSYSIPDRLKLLSWYLDQVNRLLYELTDVANFTKDFQPSSEIDPLFAFEHSLTVDRLARQTLISMSLEDPGTAKLTAFDIAELYDGLSSLLRNSQNKTGASDFFKRLFHPTSGPDLLKAGLSMWPEPFGTDLQNYSTLAYQKLQTTIIESIWFKSKVQTNGILVRDTNSQTESLIDKSDFVAEVMRAYRNAHHGYFTAGDGRHQRPARFLFLVDGNLPAELGVFPILWWLAYLANPAMVGWNRLPIGKFDDSL